MQNFRNPLNGESKNILYYPDHICNNAIKKWNIENL